MVGRGGFGGRCAAEASQASAIQELLAALQPKLRALSAEPASTSFLLASVAPSSSCMAALQSSLRQLGQLQQVLSADGLPSMSSRGPLEECLEAEFVQEVLAHSDLFLGSFFSTFSSSVHQIRVLRYGLPLDSSLLL